MLKQRNFDADTRTAKKVSLVPLPPSDELTSSPSLLPRADTPFPFAREQFSRSDLKGQTIESQVEGLAARITAEDEARRTEELVRLSFHFLPSPICFLPSFKLHSALVESPLREQRRDGFLAVAG